jgi:hypothetical protein
MIIAAQEKRYNITSLPYKIIDVVCNQIRWPDPSKAYVLWDFCVVLNSRIRN